MTRRMNLILLCSLLAAATLRAGAAPTPEEIFRRMLDAEQHVSFQGEQVTSVGQGARLKKVRQSVMHQSPNLLRIEVTFPAEMRGQVIVADGAYRWNYSPRRNEVIKTRQRPFDGKPHFRQRRNDLARKNFRIRMDGEGKVAGQDAHILELHPTGPGLPIRKLWVDKVHFVRLKTQQVASDGTVLGSTWFEKIDFTPKFDPGVFTFKPPPGVRVLEPPENDPGKVFRSQAELASKAPFPVKIPSFLPPGYRWESGALQEREGKPVVWTRYTNGMDTLSLFQRKDERGRGDQPPRPARRGATIWVHDGFGFLLVGKLPSFLMMQIANSVR